MLQAFLQRHKKLFIGITIFCLFVAIATPVQTQAATVCSWYATVGTLGICDLAANFLLIPLFLSSWILWFAGVLFDTVMKLTVVGMSEYIDGISGINIAWSVIRDFMNMSFIFILIYTAILVILDRGGNGIIKKTVSGIVIAAVLLNFSLFFTKVIIDASNLVALTIHNTIVTSCAGGTSSAPTTISECFMQPLGVSTVFNLDPSKNLTNNLETFSQLAIVSISSSVFILITAFLFFTVSVMFMIRFVNIIMLLVFSPIAVMGTLIPQLSKQTKDWWANITEQAIFPGTFMLLVWVVITIINAPGFTSGMTGKVIGGTGVSNEALAGLAVGEGASLNLVFKFFIIIFLMYSTVIIAKSFAKAGGKTGAAFAGSVIGGAGGWLGRKTIGSLSRKVADNESLKERASQSGIRGGFARLALKTGQSGAGASYDARGAKIPGTNFALPKDLGAGKAGGKGGYDAQEKASADAKTKFAKTLGASDVNIANEERKVERLKKLMDKTSNDDPFLKKTYGEEVTFRQRKVSETKDAERNARRTFEEAQITAATKGKTLGAEEKKKYNDEIKKRTTEREDAEKRITAIATIDLYKKDVVKEAQDKVDKLKGVDDDEAKKRRIKDMVASGESKTEDKARETLNKRLKDGTEKLTTIDSASTRRQQGYADSVESTGAFGYQGYIPSTKRNFLGFGSISAESRAVAMAIRKQTKGKKGADKIIEDLKKQIKDDTEAEEPKPTAAPETPAAEAAPTPPTA